MLSPSKRAAIIDPSAELFAVKADEMQRALYTRAAALVAERKQHDQGPATPEWRQKKWAAEERDIRAALEMLQHARDAVRIAHTATKGASAALDATSKVIGLDAALLLDEANRWKRLLNEARQDVARAEQRAENAEGEKLLLIGQLIAANLWPLPTISNGK